MKKVLSLMLAVVMVIGMLPLGLISASAVADGDSVKYTFSSYTAGTQYAKNEVHVLDDTVTVITNDCHFTSELRIYSSTQNNGYAIIKCTDGSLKISGIAMNAGNKADTVKIYGSNDDGVTWKDAGSITTTTTSYKDYTATLDSAYSLLKLDVAGSNQVRIKNMTLTFAASGCTCTNTIDVEAVPATCTNEGVEAGVKCADCGNEISGFGVIPALGHNYVNGVCTNANCGASEPTGYVLTELSEITADQQVIITMTKDGITWAMTNNNGTGSAPAAVAVTIEDGQLLTNVENIFWNISNDNGTLTIYPDGTTDKWLYCTNTNNGVRVGTNNNKTFTIDDTGYLRHDTAADAIRYLGVYNAQDWRCYKKNNDQIADNIAGQTLGFYVLADSGSDPTPDPECPHTNTDLGSDQSASCIIPGYTGDTYCNDCGEILSTGSIIDPLGHNYVDGVCTRCGDSEIDVPSTDATLMTELPIDGDVIIIYNSGMAMTATASSGKLSGVTATVADGKLPYTSEMAIMTVHVDGEYYSFEMNGQYLISTGTGNNLSFATYADALDNYAKWTIAAATDGTWYITSAGANYNGNYNQALETYNGLFTTYGKKETEIYQMQLFLVKSGNNDCEHAGNTTVLEAVEATCTTDGKTEGLYCNDCQTVVTQQTIIPATGHNYVNGVCTNTGCGEAAPEIYADLLTAVPVTGDNVLIYNADSNMVLTAAANGTKLNGSEGVVAESKLYYTEDQALLTVTVSGDHYIFVSGGKYLTATGTGSNLSFADTLTEGGKWTIAAATEDSWYITNAGVNYNGNYNQALEYYSGFTTYGKKETAIYQMQLFKASAADAACAHTNTTTQAAVEVTCTTNGVTEGKLCTDCGVVIAVPTVVIAEGHKYENGVCGVCGDGEPIIPDTPTTGDYTLVTDINEILAGGQFVIVANYDDINYAASTTLKGKLDVSETTISNGVVSFVEGTTPVWTVVAVDGGIALMAGEQYLTYASSTNFGAADASAPYAWSVTAVEGDEDGFMVASTITTDRALAFQYYVNNGVPSPRFAAYKDTNNGTDGYCFALNFYKLTAGGTDTPVAKNFAVVVGGEETTYATMQDAVNNVGDGYVKLLANAEVNVTLDKDLYIDLNGYYLSGTIVTNGKGIHGMDSTTDLYDCENMGEFSCVDAEGNAIVPVTLVKAAANGNKRYLAIANENGYTFHRFYLGITYATLKPSAKGVGYKAVFAGDEMVKECISSFGYTLQLGNNTPVTVSKEGSELVSKDTWTLRVDNYDTENMGLTELSASVFMVINGQTVSTATYTTTLKALVETINNDATILADAAKKEALAAWIATSETMKKWNVGNIYTEAEPEA